MGDGFQVFVAADDGTISGTKEEREAKLAERRLFEIDQYYHFIEKHTFKTIILDLSGITSPFIIIHDYYTSTS